MYSFRLRVELLCICRPRKKAVGPIETHVYVQVETCLAPYVLGICIYRTGWARNEKGKMSVTLSLGADTGSQFQPRVLASWRGWPGALLRLICWMYSKLSKSSLASHRAGPS